LAPRRRPKISIFALVHQPPGRVAAILDEFAGLDREVILAVDDRVPGDWMDSYRRIADRVLLIRFPGAFENLYPWLVSQCAGEWVMHVEDDEVPSTSLVAEIATTINSDDITHALIARRWTWPDRHSYLTQWPWRTDFHPRLLRNDPAVLRVPGRIHALGGSAGQSRVLREPLWHVHLLLRSYEERVRRGREREAYDPGAAMIAGRSVNEVYYLPEHAGQLATAPLPEVEADRVARYFEAGERLDSPRRRKASLTRFDPDEVSTVPKAQLLAPSAYGAELRSVHGDTLDAPAADQVVVELDVRNLGSELWPAGYHVDPLIRFGAGWLDRSGQPRETGQRAFLSAPLAPNQAALVHVAVPTPAIAGRYRLMIDLVHENVRWFGVPIVVEVDVWGSPSEQVGIVPALRPRLPRWSRVSGRR
jgi:hypothetical protein